MLFSIVEYITLCLATRMTAVNGSLTAFDSNTEEWTEYIECLEFSFTANGITDGAKQCKVLLSCCGPLTFCLMRSMVLPNPLTDFSFKELVAKMKAQAISDCSTLPVQFAPARNN